MWIAYLVYHAIRELNAREAGEPTLGSWRGGGDSGERRLESLFSCWLSQCLQKFCCSTSYKTAKVFFTWTILNDSQRQFAALFPKIPYKSVLASYRSIYECSREDCKMAWIHNLIKLHVHYILNRILKKATKTSWTCNIFPSISL